MNKIPAKKKIVFINQASGYLTIDIVNAFVSQFDEIALISSPLRIQERNLDPKVKLVNTFKHSRKSNRSRIFKWVLSTFHIFFLLITRFRKYEIFYITIPPLAYWGSLFLPNKFSILIYDVYPDVLKVFGVNRNNWIYLLWERVNRKLFDKANQIYTLSDDLAKKIKQYTTKNEIAIINNWSGFTEILNIDKENNPFIEEHGLNDKFVVQYAGNISVTHDLDILLELAKILKDKHNVVFLIIGRGNYLNKLQEIANNEKLNNVIFLPFQPDNILKYSLSAANISIVAVGNEVSDISVPSKIYNLQSLSIPILGIAPLNSELNKHLIKYKNGECFSSNDLTGMSNFIIRLSADPLLEDRYRNNSARAAKDFSYLNAELYVKEYYSL